MRYLILVAGFAFCLFGTGVAQAADDNMIGLKTSEGKLVYDFIDLWFNKHKTAEAFDKYVSKTDYMNHAVYSATTKKHPSFEEEKAEEGRMALNPKIHFDFKQLIAQGGLVMAHIQAFDGEHPNGDEMVMILRVKSGKIVDHWDIHAPLKDDSAVFSGLDR